MITCTDCKKQIFTEEEPFETILSPDGEGEVLHIDCYRERWEENNVESI